MMLPSGKAFVSNLTDMGPILIYETIFLNAVKIKMLWYCIVLSVGNKQSFADN